MSSPNPFRFRELPMELQEMVLEHYYGGSYDVYLEIDSIEGGPDRLSAGGCPGSKMPIERVSHRLRTLGRQVRRRLFNGTLTIKFDDNFKRQAIEKFCELSGVWWIRDRVKTLELVGYDNKWRRRIRMAAIKLIASQFAVLETISISHVTRKRVFGDNDEDLGRVCASFAAANAKLYKDAFLAGSRDIKYDSPVRTLEVQFLAKYLELCGMDDIKILVNAGTWWEGNSGIILILGVSFQVTAYGWTAVDREWKSRRDLDRCAPLHASTNNFSRMMEMAMYRNRIYEAVMKFENETE